VSRLGGWIARHRVAAGFAAGVLLTLVALAVVGYLVLADQRRTARILAAALTQALAREVRIERVRELGPSRVVIEGLRLPAERGWPAEVSAESVEASGPLLAAARGEAAPVRLLVTRPTVVVGGGGAAGAAALQGLREGVLAVLGSPALLDVAVTGGVLEGQASAPDGVTFDGTLRKGSGELQGEVLLRDRTRTRLTFRLDARGDGDTVRLGLTGEGQLAPLRPWLPPGAARAAGAAPVDVRVEASLEPRDRLSGRASVRLGNLATLEGSLSLGEGRVGVAGLRGAAELGFVASAAGRPGPARGRVELADGEVSWEAARGGWPSARAALRLAEGLLPASLAGVDVRARGVETWVAVEPREGRAAVRGELRGERVEAAGVELASLLSPWVVDLDPTGSVSRVELSGLSAQVLGAPVRGTVAYDAVRGRAAARLEATAARLDPLARHLRGGWLAETDRLHAGRLVVVATGLDPRGLSEGQVEAEVRELVLRQPGGEAGVDQARVRATARSRGATVEFAADRVRGAVPHFQGLVARAQGSADIVRDAAGPSLARARLVARDAEGREMLDAELARSAPGSGGPLRLTARLPALERLAPLWPATTRQVTGSATVELAAAHTGFGSYEGRLSLRVPGAELLGGRVSLRDLSADVPLRRGGGAAPAGSAPPGRLEVGELVGYGVVLHDVTGRPQVTDARLALADLRYGVYSGQGQGAIDLELAADGPRARARLTGAGVRVDEFVAAYGIRGGTMTGLLRYDVEMRYRGGRFGADGRFTVPEGGTVTIELLDRLLAYAEADPTGVVKRALGNLRAFDYKAADMTVRSAADDVRVNLSLQGRERFGIFPPRVKEINVRDMPLGFLARQFPGR
jgi:hypothetical protein